MEADQDNEVKQYLRNFRGTFTAHKLRTGVEMLLKNQRIINESEQADENSQMMVKAVKAVNDVLFGESNE